MHLVHRLYAEQRIGHITDRLLDCDKKRRWNGGEAMKRYMRIVSVVLALLCAVALPLHQRALSVDVPFAGT